MTETNNHEISIKYTDKMSELVSLNDLFKYLSNLLRKLRTYRNNSTDQGSLIDLFIRKCLLSLAILKFDDLIKMFN